LGRPPPPQRTPPAAPHPLRASTSASPRRTPRPKATSELLQLRFSTLAPGPCPAHYRPRARRPQASTAARLAPSSIASTAAPPHRAARPSCIRSPRVRPGRTSAHAHASATAALHHQHSIYARLAASQFASLSTSRASSASLHFAHTFPSAKSPQTGQHTGPPGPNRNQTGRQQGGNRTGAKPGARPDGPAQDPVQPAP
jgi:hypothetical protein